MVVPFGNTLHVSGTDGRTAATLHRPFRATALAWTRGRARPRRRVHQPDGQRAGQLRDARRRNERRVFLAPHLGGNGQGVRADAARPADLRDDGRHADHAADAVRLRHQHRSQGAADRGAGRRQQRICAQLRRALENSGYFRVVRAARQRSRSGTLLARGEVQFVVTIPENFARKLERGERPVLLVEADATDPAATSNALAALLGLNQTALNDLTGRAGARSAAPAAAVRAARAPPLQPGRHHAVQHRARADGRDPDDDDGDDDRARDDARARARHDGKPARDAGAAARGDGRQDRALHRRRLRAGDASSCSRRSCCSRCRWSAALRCCRWC